MGIHLIIHNVGFSLSAIACIVLFFFLLINNKHSRANFTLAFTALSVAVFIVSHVIGVNVSDPIVSRNILMFNLSMAFIGAFNVHAVLAFLNKDRERWYVLALIYAFAIFITIWFIVHPDLFLLPSVPKMYFPNYYNPGALNWIRIVYLDVICIFYMFSELFVAYRKTEPSMNRNRIKYFALSLFVAYGLGSMPNFLVYNIQIDPLWGMAFMVLFVIPFVYAVLKYELFEIKIIAKQAFLFSIAIGCIGVLIGFLDYFNRIIQESNPGFPVWIMPLLSAALIVTISGLVWRKLHESDLLKYEFVTTVTHKFRTPLTHIKWASENLSESKSVLSDEDREYIGHIKTADEKLVELTSLLMNISETENKDYEYKIERINISELASEVIDSLKYQYDMKKIQINKKLEPSLYAKLDKSRIKFIIQAFIENAVNYTPEKGVIEISMASVGKDVIFSVKDSGIGILKKDFPRLFSKFYRGNEARLADTEGMGIGLYISKEITSRHNGKIWATSEGLNKGSTFSFSLPLVK